MSMSKRKKEQQGELWIDSRCLAQAPGHPFYRKVNELLCGEGFDEYVECLCEKFYAEA